MAYAIAQEESTAEAAKMPHGVPAAAMRYTIPEPSVLTFDGALDGAALSVRLRRVGDDSGFLLMNSGFHWIQGVPFQR